ncbi:MAG: hypothetical protein QM758_12825 [Armatimonas sp.]
MRPLWLAVILIIGTPVLAQQDEARAPVRASVAPVETREVVAEGRAAIPFNADSPQAAILQAKKAAQSQALRNAVEKALGIYVSAHTLTANYQLVRDEVTTRAEGFATLQEVLSEKVTPTEVRVTLRALVSLKPLAKQLKTLGLTRAWRISVVEAWGTTPGDCDTAMASLEEELSRAGFVVTANPKEADVSVVLTPKLKRVHAENLRTAAGPMTMHSIRGDLTIKAIRAGETVAAFSASETEVHIDPDTAAGESVAAAARNIAPRLVESLLVLPASLSQTVALEISGISGATQTAKIEDALRALGGVQSVTRRGLAQGKVRWELEVYSDAVPQLARDLEGLKVARLQVQSENRTRISARIVPGRN